MKFNLISYEVQSVTRKKNFYKNFWVSNSKRGVILRNSRIPNLQIYRRTSMPKCDFNKVALQLYWKYTSAWVFCCKFCYIFSEHHFLRTPLDGCFWKSFWVEAKSLQIPTFVTLSSFIYPYTTTLTRKLFNIFITFSTILTWFTSINNLSLHQSVIVDDNTGTFLKSRVGVTGHLFAGTCPILQILVLESEKVAETPQQLFSCEFWKIPRTIFLPNSFGRLFLMVLHSVLLYRSIL